jgi:hypothetical protein
MFIIVFLSVVQSRYVCFSLNLPASKNIYPKEKTEKKKAIKRYGHCERPKGNGIIGGDPLGEQTVYAVVFWRGMRRVSIIP